MSNTNKIETKYLQSLQLKSPKMESKKSNSNKQQETFIPNVRSNTQFQFMLQQGTEKSNKILKETLAKKEIEVLSTKWISVKTKYDLLCLRCGHKWQAQGSAFFNSRSIAGCSVCARKALGEKQRGTISDLQEFAEKFGGIVLSKKYTKRNAEYKFKCKNNHIFVANYNNLAYRKQFCPTCENRQIRK